MPNANAIANVFKLIEENDIKFVLLRFTDIKGKEHGVSIPVSLVDEICLKMAKCSMALLLKVGKPLTKPICF